jgi:glutamate carboxypeptidase
MTLLDRLTGRLPDLLADLEALVACESPSDDRAAVAAGADVLAGIGHRRLGVRPERIVQDGRTHLRWRFGDGPAKVLLLGHHDTVWPIGSAARRPYGIADGILRGPGCFDMKAGVVQAVHAVAEVPDRAGITILITGDEELGSPSSRELIEQEAAGCRAALVLEGSADGGALKTERKGVSLYRVRVTGRAAHAGLEPEAGVNSTVELAHQVLAVRALADPLLGTTVTPTRIAAGTTTNTVPAAGEFAVDVRVRTAAEQKRVDAAMLALAPVLPGARIVVEGGPNRPPLEATASEDLYAHAVTVAERLGLPPLTRASVGGASDGNFTAGIGTPTLDGLGAVGGGAHADSEHVVVAELPRRAALVAALTADLLAGASAGPARR